MASKKYSFEIAQIERMEQENPDATSLSMALCSLLDRVGKYETLLGIKTEAPPAPEAEAPDQVKRQFVLTVTTLGAAVQI